MSTYDLVYETPGVGGVLGGSTKVTSINWTSITLLKEALYWHNGTSWLAIPWARVVSLTSSDDFVGRFA